MLLLVLGISGCVDVDDEGETGGNADEEAASEVYTLIELLPTNITEDNRVLVEQIREAYDKLSDAAKALVTNYDILVNAENTIAAIDAAKQAEKEEQERRNQETLAFLKEVAEDVDALIPDEVYNSFDMQYTITKDDKDVKISWSSSDPMTITVIGQVIPGYEEKEVTLTALLSYNGVSYSHSKTVIVQPIVFDELPKGRTVFAYAYGRAHGFDENDLRTIDVVNHAFASVVNGELVASKLGDRPGLLSLRTQGIRVVMSIDGYANGGIPWSKAAFTAEGREKLANSIVEQVVKYNYDGVDVDWEYPGFYDDPSWDISTKDDSANYTLMMEKIKEKLKAVNPDYIFSAAVPGGTWGPDRFEIHNIVKIFDYLHLMTYDLDATTRSTHLTALYSSSNTINADCSVDGTVKIYVERGKKGGMSEAAIREKLVVGAAFYGRKFSNTSGIGTSANGRTSVSYHNIKTEYVDKGVQERWDSVAQAPYIYDATNRVVISYDNPRSIKAKSNYVIEKGLGGMMFWQYGQDNTGTLVDAIYEGLKLGNFE